jgi:Ca2+-binding EF-hand superfamily protein
MRRAVVLGLFCGALLVFGTYSAVCSQVPDAVGKSALPPWFQKIDADNDGQIALWEWRRAHKDIREFKKWDRDGDGFITPEEAMKTFAAMNKSPAPSDKPPKVEGDLDARPRVYRAGKLPSTGLPPWFKKLDDDKDGQIALWEWRQARKDVREFKKWDRDGDGFITPEEAVQTFAALNKNPVPTSASAAQGKSGKSDKSQNVEGALDARPVVYRSGKLPAAGLPPWFEKLDADNDGQIALWEWRQAGKDLDEFSAWDRDGDGFITPEEALAAFAAVKKASAIIGNAANPLRNEAR